MNSTEFLTTVDHAAAMSDRWLFVAALCLLLLLCAAAIRWLIRQLSAVIADHKASHRAHHESLTRIIDTQNATAVKLAICIDRNTAALQECSFHLRQTH